MQHAVLAAFPQTDLGVSLLQRFAKDIGEVGMVETNPEMAGNRMHVIIAPGPAAKQKPAKKVAPPSPAPAPAPAKA